MSTAVLQRVESCWVHDSTSLERRSSAAWCPVALQRHSDVKPVQLQPLVIFHQYILLQRTKKLFASALRAAQQLPEHRDVEQAASHLAEPTYAPVRRNSDMHRTFCGRLLSQRTADECVLANLHTIVPCPSPSWPPLMRKSTCR